MKKFLLKLSAFVLCVAVVCTFTAVSFDPFNVFHWENIRDTGVGINKNYVKTKYILNHPDLFDGYVLGSSKVSALHVERIKNEKVYNMIYSQGAPSENLATVKTFIENGVNVKTIYWGLDNLSYTFDANAHTGSGMFATYQELEDPIDFLKIYLNPKTVMESFSYRFADHKTSGLENFYTTGWAFDYHMEQQITDWDSARPNTGSVSILQETLDVIREMKTLCDNNNIRLVVFTNPLCEVTYRRAVKDDYHTFLKELAGITEYYNFSGINDITSNTDNFIDTAHYRAEVGDLMLDAMCSGIVDDDLYAQGFGWLVTNENVDSLITIIS